MTLQGVEFGDQPAPPLAGAGARKQDCLGGDIQSLDDSCLEGFFVAQFVSVLA